MYAIVKPIKTTTSGAWPRAGHITADGVPLEMLVQIAYQTDHYHIDWRMPKDDNLYRAAFRVPEQQRDRLLSYVQHTLADLSSATFPPRPLGVIRPSGLTLRQLTAMDKFPEFMQHPANKIATTAQATPGVDGYVFDGADGSQMAFWTCNQTALSNAPCP
jgi:hypothetical protein